MTKFSLQSLTVLVGLSSIVMDCCSNNALVSASSVSSNSTEAIARSDFKLNGPGSRCSLRIGDRYENLHGDKRHRRMVSVNLDDGCAESPLLSIDIPHDNIQRTFNMMLNEPKKRIPDAKNKKKKEKLSKTANEDEFDYWYGEDSNDGSSFNYVQDKHGNIAGSMVDLKNDAVMQFHIEDGLPTVTITPSSDFPPEMDPFFSDHDGKMDMDAKKDNNDDKKNRMRKLFQEDVDEESLDFDSRSDDKEEANDNHVDIDKSSTMLRGSRGMVVSESSPLHITASNQTLSDRRNLSDSGAFLDIMVIWTKNAECRAMGLAIGCRLTSATRNAMQARVNLAVSETNTAFFYSGVNTRLRLVHSYRHPSYTEVSYHDTIADLREGDVPNAHELRSLYGADVVAMLINNSDYCGVGYVGPRKDLMFSVTNWSCATGSFSFGHEIGHNLGLLHDRGSEGHCYPSYILAYNYGYREPNANFRTILAYRCTAGECDNNPADRSCTRIQRFSNPSVRYNGMVTGRSWANSARQINDVKNEVARYCRHVPDTRYIRYGDKVYLQNNWINNRWLSGSRGGKNEDVVTRDRLRSDYEKFTVAKTYQWIVRSSSGNGLRHNVDPRGGQCLRYGDKIHLQNNYINHRWLSGSRSSGNSEVVVKNKLGSTYEQLMAGQTYEWIVRSTVGNGGRTWANFDPKYGDCVRTVDKIYLQNNYMNNRWLTGSRGGSNEDVMTKNKLASYYERTTVHRTYEWYIKLNVGSKGSRPLPQTC